MDNYIIQEIEGNKNLLNHYKTYQIKRKGNKQLTDEDVENLYNHYYTDDKRMLILGLGPTRWNTIKALDDPNLKKQDINYWRDKVDNPEKFLNYEVVHISFLEHKKKLSKPKISK